MELSTRHYEGVARAGSTLAIALANSSGGLALVAALRFRANGWKRTRREFDRRVAVSGLLKALNTAAFVAAVSLSTSTQAVVFEGSFVVWSLLLERGVLHGVGRRAWTSIISACLLCVGIALLSSSGLARGADVGWGLVAGIAAGLLYAGFVHQWTRAIRGSSRNELFDAERMLAWAVGFLLPISLGIAVAVPRSGLFHVRVSDFLLQLIVGALGVGATYGLVAVATRRSQTMAAGTVALTVSLLLSLSYPVTAALDLSFGDAAFRWTFLVGLALFFVGFVSLRTQRLGARTK